MQDAGAGLVALVMTGYLALYDQPTRSQADPYIATAVAGLGAMLLGFITAVIVAPDRKTEPYGAPSAASGATLSAAPLHGGALVLGTALF